MTIVVSATVASIGSAATAPLVGISSGVGITAIGKIIGKGILCTMSGALGASTSAGVILGSVSTGTVNGALVGGLAGAATSGLLAQTHNIFAGPVGWIVLGTDNSSEICTFDCWKPVLHDESPEPSDGKLLRDVVIDPLIKRVIVSNDSPLPQIILENVWNEKFLIQYLTLPSQQLGLHALRL